MNTKILFASILGGITSLILAIFLNGILFGKTFAALMGSAQNMSRPSSELIIWALIFANLIPNYLIALIYNRWANIKNFRKGAINGAIFGLLFTTGYDIITYATTNIISFSGAILEITLSGVVWAISSGVVAWYLGK